MRWQEHRNRLPSLCLSVSCFLIYSLSLSLSLSFTLFIVSRIEQFYLQESSKCLLGQYLKKLSSWEPANSGRRSPDSHSRGAHRYPYLGCSCIADLEGQSDLFKSASVDRIERFWTLWSLPGPHTVQNRSILSTGIIKVPHRAISQKVVKLGTRQLGAALIRFT